jgi:GT2 family glycosyltransferase
MTHDRSNSLARLMASLDRQRRRDASEITILDNGSATDHAAEVRRIADEHSARLIRSERNLFVAGKRVLEDDVFGRTKPDVLIRLDDDVVLDDGWLDAVLVVLDRDVAACGSVEDHDGDLAISGQRAFELFDETVGGQTIRVWDWRWHDPDLSVASERVELAGQRALAVDGRVAFNIRHDPEFLIGGEDADYSLRLRQAGYELRVARSAIIRHRTLGEREIKGYRVAENVIPSWRHFYRRWGFIRRSAAAEAAMPWEDFVAAVVEGPDD